MENAFRWLLEEAKPSLNSCPACPIKGTCVFVTPEYEPGYCLHEYKRLHAFLANRLRVHPPAGAAGFSRLVQDVAAEAGRLQRDRPYDPRVPIADLGTGHWNPDGLGLQSTLRRFEIAVG